MKHLLNGVAIAAALVFAAPAWAQAPQSQAVSGPKASGGARRATTAPAPAAAPAPMPPGPVVHKQMHHRPMRHAAAHGKMHKVSAGDAMTEQLNREELARIQGGAPMPPPPPPPRSPAYPGPATGGSGGHGAQPPSLK